MDVHANPFELDEDDFDSATEVPPSSANAWLFSKDFAFPRPPKLPVFHAGAAPFPSEPYVESDPFADWTGPNQRG
jgi:hypothetical protein